MQSKIHYKIVLTCICKHLDERDRQISTSPYNSVTFNNLNTYTNYSIQVLAYTAYGDGVRSSPIYNRTLAGRKLHTCWYIHIMYNNELRSYLVL